MILVAALGLLPIQLQHGIELVGEVGEHGADVVEDVAGVPPWLLHVPVGLRQRPIWEANAGV